MSVGGSTVAVAITGTSTLVNDGVIQQTGSGRAIDSGVANLNLAIFNNGTLSTSSVI